jgi:dihydrofolate synthase/folylpolyglutamate synthase
MRFDTLNDWLDWQVGLHPKTIDLGLERVATVWQRLQASPLSAKVITVAGTNGKGSCVAFLDAILRAAGYRVGCYTSPHLLRYNERIRIDGEEVPDEAICQAFDRIDQARQEIGLTYFEFGTLAALDLFAERSLDVIVLEVGLGGRLDAVNIIDADVAVITTIDRDHTHWLGETLEEIGREKAGIMRSGRPVVFGSPHIPHSVIQHAQDLGARLLRLGEHYRFHTLEQGWNWHSDERRRNALPLPYLRGGYQLYNAAAALMALECLRTVLPLDQRAVRVGLQDAQLAGRLQVLGRDPLVVLDVAHNEQAVKNLADNLKDMFSPGRTLALFSMLGDKDLAAVIAVMAPLVDDWYITVLEDERAASRAQLLEAFGRAGIGPEQIRVAANLTAAIDLIQANAQAEDRIVVFGSFLTVAKALERF